jgi:hypothetical protein
MNEMFADLWIVSEQGDNIGRIYDHWAIVCFGQFLKSNWNNAQFWALFQGIDYICVNFDKKGLGYILGDFFTNPSGHPDRALSRNRAALRSKLKCKKSSFFSGLWRLFLISGSFSKDGDRVTRCVCEKNCPNCSPKQYFFVKMVALLLLWKTKVAEQYWLIMYFYKNKLDFQSKHLPKRRKFAKIGSPWRGGPQKNLKRFFFRSFAQIYFFAPKKVAETLSATFKAQSR